jgi:MSHA biogenesis protein MshL
MIMRTKRFLPLCGALLALALAAPLAAGDEPRFDVNVVDAPARTFFEGLVDGTSYNIMLEPGVGGTLTLKLKNVTVPEVLDAVRDAYGYDFHKMATGYVIVPPALQTRMFQVNYLDLERRGTSRTRVTSGQISQGGTQQPTTTQAGSSSGALPQSSGLSEPPGAVFGRGSDNRGTAVADITGTSVSTRSSSDFWHDLEVNLRSFVGTDGGHGIFINPQAGIIAVRGTPRELRDVQEFLHRIESVSTRQVVLEAKILEVTLSDGMQAGINWAYLGHKGATTTSLTQTGPQQGFGSNTFSSNTDLLNQPSTTVSLTPGSSNPVSGAVTNTLGGAFAVAVNGANFASYIELLSTAGKTRVLSSPRVSTLNNQKAVIKAGSDAFFVTGVSSNTVVGTSSATNLNVDLTPFFSGVALDVTPQISEDGEVILHIHPTVSEVTAQITQLTAGGTTDTLPLAYSEVRESDSVVKAKSGQLIVIGGLMRTEHTYQDYRLPILGDIPLIGNLFKSQQKQDVHTELVILLRPIVVSDDGQWSELADEPLRRADALDPKSSGGVR